MGFVMLGIATLTEIGFQAAMFGMVAHGVITGMLFFCVGSIYDRYHTREIARDRRRHGAGDAEDGRRSSRSWRSRRSGCPGLAGFWGEVMALLSSFQPERRPGLDVGLFRAFMVMGGIGTVLTAGYFLWMLQRVNMGTLPEQWKESGFTRHPRRSSGSPWVPLLAARRRAGPVPADRLRHDRRTPSKPSPRPLFGG